MNINLKEYVSLLGKYLAKEKWGLASLFAILIFNVWVETAKPAVLGNFMDQVVGTGPMGNLYKLAFYFLVLTLLKQGITILIAYLTQNIGWRATNGLRIDLTDHAMDLDMSFHKRFTPGQLVERVDGDINSLFGFFTTFITGIIMNAFLLLGVLIRFATIYPLVDLVYLGGILALYLYMGIMAKPIDRAAEGLREEESQFYGLTGELITSVEDIRSLNARRHSMNLVSKVLQRLSPFYQKDMMYGFGTWAASEFILWTLEFFVIVILASQVLTGKMSVGMAYMVHRLGELIVGPIIELREELLYIQKTDASIRRIRELMDERRHLSEGQERVAEDGGDLTLDHVSFHYEDDEPVIKDVSFHLPKGQILGILGRTGSGKTTLARLIVKLYEPTSGQVQLDGLDLRQLSDESLRQKISYVTQEVQLFNATVRDNLTMYNPAISDEKILSTLKAIGIDEWFDKLPQGLDTKLTTEAPFLSTGELQLMAFIRVFLKEPDIVILDEATSKLDPVTEKYLEKALNTLLKDRSAIIIAHRLKTVLRSDKILILEDGEIAEFGETRELTRDPNSRFANLLKRGLEEVLV